MTKILTLTTGIALAAMLVSLPAQAEPVDFGALVGTGTYKLAVSPYASGEISTPSAGQSGLYYVGLTLGQLMTADGSQNIGDPFYMYCVDFLGSISPPTTFNVLVESLATGADSSVPDNLGLTLGTLRLQATLGTGFGTSPSGNASIDSDVQEDIWNLSGGHFTPPVNNMAADLSLAEAAVGTADFTNAYFLDITPAGEQNAQAFMPVDAGVSTGFTPVTPEPSTFGLLLFAIGGLAAAARGKLRKNQ